MPIRLIDANALKQHYNVPDAEGVFSYCDTIMRVIDEQPTIEPEVRHGRWMNTNETVWDAKEIDGKQQLDISIVSAKCSVCGRWAEQVNNFPPYMKYNFCPNCGARMDATDTNVGGKGGADNG